MRLPALERKSSAAVEVKQSGVSQVRTPNRHRILVVDDNADAAESLALLLRMQGHEIQVACDGVTALQVAEQFRPEVVLLDIGLPRLDGYQVARRLRQQPGADRMLLVALTGYGQDDDRRRSAEAGFSAHLVKPLDLQVLGDLLMHMPNILK